MKLTAVKHGQSLVEEVCQQLAARIRQRDGADDGWLPPERTLAIQLGVSRTVVREAVKRLELQGLLEVRHGVGIRAVDQLHSPLCSALELILVDEAVRLKQLCEARLTIEPEVARLAAERAKAADIKLLVAAQAALAAAEDAPSAVEADLQFHRALAQAAGNEVFTLLLDSLAELGRASRELTIGTGGKAPAYDGHAAILSAVKRRDPAGAREAMQRHMTAASHDLQQNLPGKRRKR
jgi:GntR family transcriptional regulator, transcriptional repressor for pyruvate dehydrogenase complex